MAIFFDIETCALPWDEVTHLAPDRLLEERPSNEEVEAFMAALPSNYKAETREKKAREWLDKYDVKAERKEWMSKAALDPTRSYVYSYSIIRPDGQLAVVFADEIGGEKELLAAIVEDLGPDVAGPHVYTWNGDDFDIPFLVWRLALNRMPVPRWADAKPWQTRFIDLKRKHAGKWSLPIHKKSLDYVARAFGENPKIGSGADFAGWDRMKQIEYAEDDVRYLARIAARFCESSLPPEPVSVPRLI